MSARTQGCVRADATTRSHGRAPASARTDFYRVRGVNADASGRPDGNFHPKMSFMTSLIRRACKSTWQLGAYCTIDEIMVRYKGSYCPIRQYLPMKPEKWDIKIWC
jgi:hypothetical protein